MGYQSGDSDPISAVISRSVFLPCSRTGIRQSMEEPLRIGAALYNDGFYHAAHDPWEEQWLSLEDDTRDERFLHGLIQFTAAIHHACSCNRNGATGLAESALEYLSRLPSTYRGVALDPIRAFLGELTTGFDGVDLESPPAIRIHDEAISRSALSFDETMSVAAVIAEEFEYDERTVELAVEYARVDHATGNDRFIALLYDFVNDDEYRDIAFERLSQHVKRRRHREGDVEDLF